MAVLFTASVVCGVPTAWATAQAPDAIEIDGKEFSLNTNPLERYLSAHPHQRPKSRGWSSGLWRGYIAHWQIAEGTLRLVKVEALVDEPTSHVDGMRDVTAQYFPNAPMVAEWYSGALIIPTGKLVNYVHMGYGSTYDSYTVIVVKSGVVAKRDDLSLEQFNDYRRRKFEEFKATDTYAKEFERTSREFKDKAMAEEFLFEIFAEQYLSDVDQPN